MAFRGGVAGRCHLRRARRSPAADDAADQDSADWPSTVAPS